jgi:hypothetical protein
VADDLSAMRGREHGARGPRRPRGGEGGLSRTEKSPRRVTGGYALNKRFLLDLAEDWQQHGREVFKRVRRESPAAYLKVCAMLVPREMKLEHSGGVKAMTDEQIERAIEAIEELIAKRQAGENAEVIEGVAEREAGANAKVIQGAAEPVPALPPPSRKARRKVRRSD